MSSLLPVENVMSKKEQVILLRTRVYSNTTSYQNFKVKTNIYTFTYKCKFTYINERRSFLKS